MNKYGIYTLNGRLAASTDADSGQDVIIELREWADEFLGADQWVVRRLSAGGTPEGWKEEA